MDLQPLEELLIDKLEVAKDIIASKWDKQPNKPEKKEIKKLNAKNITDKF